MRKPDEDSLVILQITRTSNFRSLSIVTCGQERLIKATESNFLKERENLNDPQVLRKREREKVFSARRCHRTSMRL